MNLYNLTAKLTLNKVDYEKGIIEAKVDLQSVGDEAEKQSKKIEESFSKSAVNIKSKIDLVIGAFKFVADVVKKTKSIVTDYANSLGDTEVAERVQSFSNRFNGLITQGKEALASFVLGAEDGEKKLDEFFNNILAMIEAFTPKIVSLGVKLLTKLFVALIKALPNLLSTVIETLMNIDWYDVGLQIGQALLKGIWGTIKESFARAFGKGWLWGKDNKITTTTNSVSTVTNTTGTTEKIEVEVRGTGTSNIDRENMELLAEKLTPVINKKIGEMI